MQENCPRASSRLREPMTVYCRRMPRSGSNFLRRLRGFRSLSKFIRASILDHGAGRRKNRKLRAGGIVKREFSAGNFELARAVWFNQLPLNRMTPAIHPLLWRRFQSGNVPRLRVSSCHLKEVAKNYPSGLIKIWLRDENGEVHSRARHSPGSTVRYINILTQCHATSAPASGVASKQVDGLVAKLIQPARRIRHDPLTPDTRFVLGRA